MRKLWFNEIFPHEFSYFFPVGDNQISPTALIFLQLFSDFSIYYIIFPLWPHANGSTIIYLTIIFITTAPPLGLLSFIYIVNYELLPKHILEWLECSVCHDSHILAVINLPITYHQSPISTIFNH